ncbi:hypothetical protein B0H19DRAFT_1079697 [Mycena capillaripes]|nr:hypothetical protein B0H19DRAFT_1079697 [Mycena capillaripes]
MATSDAPAYPALFSQAIFCACIKAIILDVIQFLHPAPVSIHCGAVKGQSKSVEDAKNWESDRFVKKLTLLSGARPEDSDPEHEHRSTPCKMGERGPTIPALDREVNFVHKAFQGPWEMKMKVEKYHTGATLPRAKLA